MKTYEVLVKAYSVVVVRAEDEEDAARIAFDEVTSGKFENDEANVEKELKTPQEVESALRHATVKDILSDL